LLAPSGEDLSRHSVLATFVLLPVPEWRCQELIRDCPGAAWCRRKPVDFVPLPQTSIKFQQAVSKAAEATSPEFNP
jgi:hypothetical protein